MPIMYCPATGRSLGVGEKAMISRAAVATIREMAVFLLSAGEDEASGTPEWVALANGLFATMTFLQ